jgi:hypothetical protein
MWEWLGTLTSYMKWVFYSEITVPPEYEDALAANAAVPAPAVKTIVNSGSTCMCDKGLAPCPVAMGLPTVMTSATPALNESSATISVLPTFGMCTSQANPTVATATAAAMGVLTPMPCVPVFIPPWSGTSTTVNLAGLPAVNAMSSLKCSWGGTIKVTVTANQTVKTS